MADYTGYEQCNHEPVSFGGIPGSPQLEVLS